MNIKDAKITHNRLLVIASEWRQWNAEYKDSETRKLDKELQEAARGIGINPKAVLTKTAMLVVNNREASVKLFATVLTFLMEAGKEAGKQAEKEAAKAKYMADKIMETMESLVSQDDLAKLDELATELDES